MMVLASPEKINRVKEMETENQQSNDLTQVHLPTAAVCVHLDFTKRELLCHIIDTYASAFTLVHTYDLDL